MIKAVPVPLSPLLRETLTDAQFSDAYQISLANPEQDISDITFKLFTEGQQSWIKGLMVIRNKIVSPFGLKTGAMTSGETKLEDRIGIFKIYQRDDNEVLLGENDKHLDFRISVLKDPTNSLLTVTTKVKMHNALGRAYIAIITPFHRMIVKSMIRKAKQSGAF